MTQIEVPDWVTKVAEDARVECLKAVTVFGSAGVEERYHIAMKAALTAALGAWVVREGYIAGPELRGLDAARQLGRKLYGNVWSEPTGQAGTPLYTLRQEKPE